MSAEAIRFADVGLGDALPVSGADGGGDWTERARRLVQSWSGADEVGMTHCREPSPAAAPREMAARVFARHLDDSRRVEVEVVGRDRGVVCATAVVSVALR